MVASSASHRPWEMWDASIKLLPEGGVLLHAVGRCGSLCTEETASFLPLLGVARPLLAAIGRCAVNRVTDLLCCRLFVKHGVWRDLASCQICQTSRRVPGKVVIWEESTSGAALPPLATPAGFLDRPFSSSRAARLSCHCC
jgi:hypothetical protein